MHSGDPPRFAARIFQRSRLKHTLGAGDDDLLCAHRAGELENVFSARHIAPVDGLRIARPEAVIARDVENVTGVSEGFAQRFDLRHVAFEPLQRRSKFSSRGLQRTGERPHVCTTLHELIRDMAANETARAGDHDHLVSEEIAKEVFHFGRGRVVVGAEMTRLLITGDDFGASHEVNEAVEAQYQAGRLSQASLMIHGRCLDEAKRNALRNPGLCVGLHLTLCTAARGGQTELTDTEGNFEPSPALAGVKYFADARLRAALRAEIEEQFVLFLAAGFPPVYWDGHTHLHLHPTIFQETLPIARRHGFRAVRLLQTQNTGLLGWIFNQLSASARKQLGNVQFADRTFGLRETGKVDDAAFARLLLAARSYEMAEIYYHPGVDGPREGELPAGLRLTSWREIDAALESR